MPQDVFVSYSSIDKTVADGVRRDRAAWDRVLDRPRDILPGLDWGGAIIDAISGCRVMVLVFSGNANRSQQIKREVERAVNKGVTIVPLRIEDVPLGKTLEYFISTAHWLDAFPGPLDRHMEKLAETVETLLARRPSTSVSVPRPPIPSPSPAASRQSPALEASRMPGDAAAFAGRGGGEGQGWRPRALLLGATALALLLFFVMRALRSSPPEIVGVRFPPVLTAGTQGTGSIQFRDSKGDVATAVFEVCRPRSSRTSPSRLRWPDRSPVTSLSGFARRSHSGSRCRRF